MTRRWVNWGRFKYLNIEKKTNLKHSFLDNIQDKVHDVREHYGGRKEKEGNKTKIYRTMSNSTVGNWNRRVQRKTKQTKKQKKRKPINSGTFLNSDDKSRTMETTTKKKTKYYLLKYMSRNTVAKI